MASAKGIKKRRNAAQNIHKITKTMGLVATTKLKMASQKLANFQKYQEKVREILARLLENATTVHPFQQENPKSSRVLILAISSNRGLCGTYNSRLVNEVNHFCKQLEKEGKQSAVYMTGRKGILMCKFQDIKLTHSYPGIADLPSWEEAEPIAQTLMDLFAKSKSEAQNQAFGKSKVKADAGADEVWLIYTRKFRVMKERLFPLSLGKASQETKKTAAIAHTSAHAPATVQQKEHKEVTGHRHQQYFYWPDPNAIMAELLPLYIKSRLWEVFLQATISEQTARMLAMKTATENADDMIKQLTRLYNRARQSQITQEILEILRGSQTTE